MNPTPTLEALYRDIAPDLSGVEEEIREALRGDSGAVAEMSAHASRYGGKRLRPAMVLMVARAAGASQIRHLRLGAVVELIHLATLIHDDVIDEAEVRRSQATINAHWSNYEAVLLGDIVFARAINLLARLGDTNCLLGLTSAVSTLCEGEILQNRHRKDAALSEDLYYQIIEAKTAELYATGCELSALLAGATGEVANGFRRFGRELGLAFQIVDDCLDLVGDQAVVGKSLGTDLRNGKMTLPLIFLRKHLGAPERARLDAIIANEHRRAEEAQELADWLQQDGAVEEAFTRAEEHVAAALEAARAAGAGDFAPLEAIGEFVLRRRL